MSANQSDLSNAHYGYDVVVATTQKSINATMDEFLSELESPEVIKCYVMDENGNPQEIDYNELIQRAKGTDPFNVPKGTATSDQAIQNLSSAFFMYAFKAKIGLPQGYAPLTPNGPELPDIVELGSSASAISFNLMCSEFDIVQASYGPRGIIGWLNESQQPGGAWTFKSQVDLRMGRYDDSKYNSLPVAVQNRIKNLGTEAFSIQQLFFDLDNAALESIPSISGVAPGTPLYSSLQEVFLGAYFSEIQKNGAPVLNYTLNTHPGPSDPQTALHLTDLNMEVTPFLDSNGYPTDEPTQEEKDLSTLNYLVATDGKELPPAVPFTWNWLEASDATSHDGVISVNRKTLAKFFENQLIAHARKNCYLPKVHVWLHHALPKFSQSMTGNQMPKIVTPTSGNVVLAMTYGPMAKYDQAGLGGDMGRLRLTSSYNLTVTFVDNKITISQHLVVKLYVRKYATSAKANVVDKQIIETFTLSVDDEGKLHYSDPETNIIDNSKELKANPFLSIWANANGFIHKASAMIKGMTNSSLKDLPVSTIENFVFPGGKTFTYSDVQFSDNQDLVSRINYVDPD